MNSPGNPRLLKYWRDYYRRKRDALHKRGLTVRGTPRKLHGYTDPTVRDAVQRANAMRYYHNRVDRLRAAGLTAKGTPLKRNFPRHQHPDFINPLQSPAQKLRQAEIRRNHHAANQRKHQRALRQRNIALGLTSKGLPRKRAALSRVAIAYREFRETINIKPIPDLGHLSQKSLAEKLAA